MEAKAKTKIWHGGLPSLLGAENAAQAQAAVAAAVAPLAPAGKGDAEPIAPVAAPTQSGAGKRVLPAPAGVATPSSWQAVTRVLPIEHVFPNAAGAERTAAAHVAAARASAIATAPITTAAVKTETESAPIDLDPLWPPLTLGARLRARLRGAAAAPHAHGLAARRARGLSGKLGRERLMLYGGMLALVTALLLVRVVRGAGAEAGEPPAVDAPAAQRAESLPVAPRSATAAAGSAATATAAPRAAGAIRTAPQGLERAAADALARGDYAAAERIYAELAKSVPEPSAYSEAARILSQAAQPATQ